MHRILVPKYDMFTFQPRKYLKVSMFYKDLSLQLLLLQFNHEGKLQFSHKESDVNY